jgi:CBS domain containing-hemolysin-like protein/mannitol/fructose-specific phosphotransferase system IIA component (Ntr-type)
MRCRAGAEATKPVDLWYLLIAFLLVLVNAFFAMAEYSLVRIRASRLEELIREGRRAARLIRYAVERIDGYLSAVQLGITMTSLGLGWVGEPALGRLIQRLIPALAERVAAGLALSLSFTLAFLLITALHILFGELVPKLTAISNPERAAAFTIYPMTGFYFLSFLPIQLLRRAANGVLRLFGARGVTASQLHSEDEIKILLEQREEEGELSLRRLLMFENLFDFGRARVREVMTPRGSIAYLSCARRWEENLMVMMQRKASRYPVCREDLDTVAGYVHVKDLAFEYMSGEKEPDLLAVRRPLLYFREDTPLEEAVRRLQYNRISLAVVLNQRKKVAGLISLEDLLEEIVGEIRDEFENAPQVRLSRAFVSEAVDLNVCALDRFELLRQAVGRLHATRPIFDYGDALEQVYQRERGLSSALGHEAAFPHARIQSLAEPLFTFLRCPDGVELGAPDGKPVRLGFLILTPFTEPTAQLQLLSQLARLVLNTPLKQRLLEAENTAEVAEVIGAFESTIPL